MLIDTRFLYSRKLLNPSHAGALCDKLRHEILRVIETRG